MKTCNFRLLVLVPHRDARLPLRAWSASLFATGYPGAWSFPWLAPLTLLKRPLSAEELKRLAHALRWQLNSEGGKFIAKPPSMCALPAEFPEGRAAFVYGPTLDTVLGDDFFEPVADAVSSRISPLILGTALIQEAEKGPVPINPASSPPQISFRAAALANMSYVPLKSGGVQSGYSFEWKLGPLHWLPKKC
jgi:hypothetical protein